MTNGVKEHEEVGVLGVAPFLFKIHVVMAFVLLGDVLFALLFALPLRLVSGG